MVAPASRRPQSPPARLTEAARTWSDVSIHPDPEGPLTFRLDTATIGVLRPTDTLEVPVPEPIRTVLLERGLAVAPEGSNRTDWVAHSVSTADDVAPATLLLRLSYLYRRLLRAQDAAALHRIRVELDQRNVPEALRTVYDAMIAKRDAAADSSPHPSSS